MVSEEYFNKMKKRFPNCVIIYIYSDYYAMYKDDIEVAKKELGIEPIDNKASFPRNENEFDVRVSQLIRNGHRVILAEE